MFSIKRLTGLEILDSRGRPTVQATCALASGAVGTASVPSGASTGAAEALELRDGDPQRYRGLGCRRAVGHINGELNRALAGQSFEQQSQLDQAMLDLDGTANKSRLGANAILAVSLAFARACAAERGVPLYQYWAGLLDQPLQTLPRPTINLFSGGKHAGGQTTIQDVLIVPTSAHTIDEALAMTFAVYQAAAELSYHKYGMRALTADEGGLAPPFASAEAMLADAVEAIRNAGFEPGQEVALAVDVAASHFYQAGRYHLGTEPLDSRGMIAQLLTWLERYPIVSLEDGLAEEDWAHWPELRAAVAGRALVLGDDLLCTNSTRIRRAIAVGAADALLLKVNQIGTLSEAAEACQLARSAGWRVTISARSGETEDNWLADLAVGWAGDQIKVGSITQSERLAKYNRLLAIEAETGLPLVNWP
ncbi:MAG: phosphopyruvate hydratase [Anaerolineae bacterium]|nr:phosphopyruvate hydratase [Anaerolineales bacterium]MCQ3975150.1 phosphopyruvate hydratase [Anaerolineae bacterium]